MSERYLTVAYFHESENNSLEIAKQIDILTAGTETKWLTAWKVLVFALYEDTCLSFFHAETFSWLKEMLCRRLIWKSRFSLQFSPNNHNPEQYGDFCF